jgi:phospholipid-translocating ATPase
MSAHSSVYRDTEEVSSSSKIVKSSRPERPTVRVSFEEPDSHVPEYVDEEILRSPREPPKKGFVSGVKRGSSKLARNVSKRIPGLDKYLGLEEEQIPNLERTLYFNQSLPPSDIDPETGYPLMQYPRNKIRTTKYTPLNFIPLNLFYQFHNIANIYFLFIAILSAFPIFGVAIPGLAAVPIIAIVTITAIKDAIEDYRRTVLDLELNNTITCILSNFDNPNVVEENVSAWRRFKKVSTKVLKRVWFGISRFFLRIFRRDIPEVELPRERPDDELRSVYSNSSTGGGVLSSTTSSVYPPGQGPQGPPGSLMPSKQDMRPTPASSGKLAIERDYGSVIDRSRDAKNDAKFRKNYWKNIKCGDIIKIFDNDEVPSDVVILATSDEEGACFIETRNLDGETNLKSRQSLRASSRVHKPHDLEQSMFRIECEKPHMGLYSFNGVLKWDQRVNPNVLDSPYKECSEPISINNLLLRGSTLRNTKWAIGMVVYTGAETKIMLNAGITPAKRSRLTRALNFNVICNFFFLIMFALVAGIVNGVYYAKNDTSATFFEFGSIGGSAPVDGIVTFWAAVILLQSLIPISLYISIEIVKTIQAFFIYSDLEMYYEPLDYPCTPKSWSISDDVGQVEYIFSDKTGTLTQNFMEFRKCTINGVAYGNAFTEAMLGMMKRAADSTEVEKLAASAQEAVEKARISMLGKLQSLYDNPYLFEDEMAFVSDKIVDDLKGGSGEVQQAAVDHFFLALALCHSVLPEHVGESQEKLRFKAQSPDESALVATAKDMGYTLVDRTRNGVIVDVQGVKQEYEVLTQLEFSSTRKRMSVIVQIPETGKLLLLCKGADSVIYSRLAHGGQGDNDLKQRTADQLEEFASEGLRTLCLAEKELAWDEYRNWAARFAEASAAIQDREDKMEELADEIERGLTLIGGTAIEDRLQDGVSDAIELLGKAGVKLWVLTGDKVETAINIGYSCNLLDSGMEILVLQAHEPSPDEINKLLSRHLAENFNLMGTEEEIQEAKNDHSPPSGKFAIVIDGDTLAVLLSDPDACTKFVLLSKHCRSVLCCRVSPAQKAHVVRLVKTTLDVTTLAIGDGANDVAMIQEADVGVGIAGVEGRQAVMSSDYAIGQFRFLTKLVLVHGRWSYNRLAEMIANLFYKNVVFTLTLFWYDVHNSFDGSYLFDYTYITLFNLAFTSLPVIFMGFSDQDVSANVSLAVPQLYVRGILRKQWTNVKFWYVTIYVFC